MLRSVVAGMLMLTGRVIACGWAATSPIIRRDGRRKVRSEEEDETRLV